MDNPFACQDRARRRRVRNLSDVNGVEAVRVISDTPPVVLEVRVFRNWPPHHPNHPLTRDNVRIEGGRYPLHATGTSHFENDPNGGGVFRVALDCPGDPATTYTLRLVDAHDPTQPPPNFDPQLSHIAFVFKRHEILDEDPLADLCPPELPPPAPSIDYLAKDYASFRRLMLDRLAQTVPAWTERHAADLGVTLVEVLAYVADRLSYYQDTVATEAYLATARRRTSVRRHVRLVDYPMHDGCNARTWVCLRVASDTGPLELKGLTFYTSPDPLTLAGPAAPVRSLNDLAGEAGPAGAHRHVVFEPVRKNDGEKRSFFQSHNEIDFYTWGDRDCCLPKGATSATLVAPKPTLQIGDVLFLEEVVGPVTGQPADADARRRWFVRLTGVEATSDHLAPDGPVDLLNVTWDVQDALPFALCISAGTNRRVSVARGNVLLVDHGLTQEGVQLPIPPAPEGAPMQRTPTRVRLATPLEHAAEGTEVPLILTDPLTWAAPYPGVDAVAALQAWRLALRLASGGFASLAASPAQAMRLPSPLRAEIAGLERQMDAQVQRVIDAALAGQPMSRDAENDINELLKQVARVYAKAAHQPAAGAGPYQGTAPPPAPPPGVHTLADFFEFIGPASQALANDPLRAVPVVRLEDAAGATWLPRRDLLASGPDDRHFVVEVEEEGDVWLRFGDGVRGRAPDPGTTYKVHCRVGNGAAGNVGAETLVNLFGDPDWLYGVSNPLPATGGTDPEPLERVRLLAPTAFRVDLRRAVCAEDYVTLTQKDGRVQRAAAQLIWTGTHYEVRVAVDLLAEALAPQFDAGVQQRVIFDQLAAMLNRYRRMGHEVTVVPPNYVPLVLCLRVCVADHAERGRAKAAVEGVLGAGTLPGGKRGFFHPDNLTFGQTIDQSQLVALVQGVPGVTSATVLEFRRETDPPGGVEAELTTGPLEIPQLDGGHGQLSLKLVGGR